MYLRRFQEDGRIDHEEIRRRASAYLEVIERENPAYVAEMRGIAEGSHQDILDIVAVNVRYEILYTEFVRVGLERELAAPGVGGCTSFAILPSHTSNGHLLIGQNWDWIPEVRGTVVAAQREGLPQSLGFTEAGIAGAKIGVNAAGIGLAINGLVTDKDSWARLRKPFHVRCWEVLASRTLEDAVRAVAGTERACSANFVVGSQGRGGPRSSTSRRRRIPITGSLPRTDSSCTRTTSSTPTAGDSDSHSQTTGPPRSTGTNG